MPIDLELAQKILDQQRATARQTPPPPQPVIEGAPQIDDAGAFSQTDYARKMRAAGTPALGMTAQTPSWNGEVAPAMVQAAKAKTYDILSVPERWTGTNITGARGLKDYYQQAVERGTRGFTPAQQTAVKVAETAQDLAIKAPLFAGVGKLAEPVAGAVAGTAGKVVGKLLPRVAPLVTRIGTHALKTGLEMGTVDAATTPEAPGQAFAQGFKSGAELGAAGEVFAPLTRILENRPVLQRVARGAVGGTTMGGLTAAGAAIDAARQGKDLGQALEEAAPDIAAQALTGAVMEGALQKSDLERKNGWIRERQAEMRASGIEPDRKGLGELYDRVKRAGSKEEANTAWNDYLSGEGRRMRDQSFAAADEKMVVDAAGNLKPHDAAAPPAERRVYRDNNPEHSATYGLVMEHDGEGSWVASPERAAEFERQTTGRADAQPQGYDFHFKETPEGEKPYEAWGTRAGVYARTGNERPRRLDSEQAQATRELARQNGAVLPAPERVVETPEGSTLLNLRGKAYSRRMAELKAKRMRDGGDATARVVEVPGGFGVTSDQENARIAAERATAAEQERQNQQEQVEQPGIKVAPPMTEPVGGSARARQAEAATNTAQGGTDYKVTPEGVQTWTTADEDGLPFVRRRYPDGRWTNVENGVEQAIPTYQWPQFDEAYGAGTNREPQPLPPTEAQTPALTPAEPGITPGMEDQTYGQTEPGAPGPDAARPAQAGGDQPTAAGGGIGVDAGRGTLPDAGTAAAPSGTEPGAAGPGGSAGRDRTATATLRTEPAQLTPERQGLFDALTGVLGHRVAAVQGAEGAPLAFDGTLDESGNLLVAADAADPVQVVATHEAVHGMRKADPDLYQQVVATFEELRGQAGQVDEAEYRRFVAARNKWRAEHGLKPLSADKLHEEVMAHLGGDFAMEPAFWQRLLARSPEAFQRLAGRLLNLYDRILTALTGQAHQPWAKDQILKTVQARETMREAIAEALGEHARRQRGETTAGSAEGEARSSETAGEIPEGKARQGKAAAPVAGLGDMNGTLAERLIRLGGLSAELASEMQKKGALDGLSAAKRRKLAPTLYGEAPGPVGLDEIRQELSDAPELGMSGVELDFDGLPGKDATLDWLSEQMHEKLLTGKYHQQAEARAAREQEAEWEREYQREQERLAAMTPEERAAYEAEQEAQVYAGESSGEGDELPFMQRRREEAAPDFFGQPREERPRLTEPRREEPLKPGQADLAEIMQGRQETVIPKQQTASGQGDLFSREAFGAAGTPSAEAKLGPSTAPKDIPDLFEPESRPAEKGRLNEPQRQFYRQQMDSGKPYDAAVAAQVLHMDSPLGDWKAVPVKGHGKTKGPKGEERLMPIFDFKPDYKTASSVHPDDSCQLCGHPIRNWFWIQNDTLKQTLGVGSECVRLFEQGKSGKELSEAARRQVNRDLFDQVLQYRRMLNRVFMTSKRQHGTAWQLWKEGVELTGNIGNHTFEAPKDAVLTRWAGVQGNKVTDWLGRLDAFMSTPEARQQRDTLERWAEGYKNNDPERYRVEISNYEGLVKAFDAYHENRKGTAGNEDPQMFMARRQEAAPDFFGISRDEAERGRQEAPKTAEYSSTEAQPEKREAAAEPALEPGWRKRLLQRKRTSAGDYLSELIDYGGAPTRRGEVIADLRRQGLSDRQIDAYMMGVRAQDKNKPSPPAATDEELLFMERREQENRPSQRAFPERLRTREDEPIPIVRMKKDVTLRRKDAIDQVMVAHQNGEIPVRLSSEGIEYTISKRRLYKMTAELGEDGKPKPYQRERIAAIQSLDELARVAVEGDSRPDKGRDPNVEKIREFFAPFQFGEEIFRVRLLAKEFKPEAKLPNPLHSMAIEDVILEKVPADREASGGVEHLLDNEVGRAGNEAGEATAHAEGSTLSIGQLFGLGKGENKPGMEEMHMERRVNTRAEDERRTLKADLAKAATKGGARAGDVDRLSRADQQAGSERRTAEMTEQARVAVEKDSGKPYGFKTSNLGLSYNPTLGYGIVDKTTGKRIGKDAYDTREEAERDLQQMRHPKTVYQAVREAGRRGRAKGWEARGDYDTATMNSTLAQQIGATLQDPPATFKKSMNLLIDTLKKLGRQEAINSGRPTESVLKQVLGKISEAHKGEPEKWLNTLDDMNGELVYAEEMIRDTAPGSRERAVAAHDMLRGWMPEDYEAALLAGAGGSAERVFKKLRGLLDEEMKKAAGAAMVKVFSRVDPLKLHDAELRGQWSRLVEKSGLGALDALARKLKDQKGAFKKFNEEKNPTPEEIKAREEEIEATREQMKRAAQAVKAQDAREILNKFREIEATSDQAKEVIIEDRRITRAGLAEAGKVESENARDPLAEYVKTGNNPKRMGFIRDKMVRWFTAENLAEYLAGGKEDGIIPILLRKMRADSSAARTDQAALDAELTEELKHLGVKETDVMDWKGIENDYTFQGQTFKFTDAQLMDLYLLMRDPQARGILVRNGIKPIAKRGLTQRIKDLIKAFDKDGRPDPTGTEAEINRLTDHLSETQKQAALAMARIKNEYSASAGNAMSRKVFGYEKFLNDNHWRMKVDTVDKGLEAADIDKLGTAGGRAETMTKAAWITDRVQHKHQVLIEDAFNAFDEQVKKVTTFSRMALSVTDMLATLKNDGVAGELSKRFGTETVGMLRDMVLRDAGLIEPPAPGAFKRGIQRLYRGYAISTLGFRPSSIMKNWMGGTIMYAAELAKLDPAAGSQFLNTLRILKPFAYRFGEGKRIYELLMKNGYFQQRWAGDSAYTFAGSAVDREAFTGRGKLLKRKLENFSLSGMAAAEINNAIGAFKVLKKAGYTDAKALETVELLTRRTQNASTALEDTTWGAEMRENGMNFVFPFMNQTFVQANVLVHDLNRLMGARRRGESTAKAWSDLGHTATGYAATALMGAAVGLAFALSRKDAWLGDDEKKRKARADAIWNSVGGMAGEIVDDVAPGSSHLLDPIIKGGIDQIRDEDGKPRLEVLEKTITDLMRQGSSSPVSQMAATGLEAARQTVSMAGKGYEPWKMQRVAANTIRLTSQIFALPIGGIEQAGAATYGLATGRQYGRKEK